jgi:hypothetical protein
LEEPFLSKIEQQATLKDFNSSLASQAVNTLVWFSLLFLGVGKQFGFDKNLVLTTALALSLAKFFSSSLIQLPRYKSIPGDVEISPLIKIGRWTLAIAFASQIFAAIQAESDLALLQTGVVFVWFTFSICWRASISEIISSLTMASYLIVALSWLLEFTGLSNHTFRSGYALNPLGYRFMGVLSHPNQMGLLVTVSLAMAIFSKKRSWVTILLLAVTLLATEYRGGLIALLVMFMLSETTRRVGYWKARLSIEALLGATITFVFANPRLNEDDISTGRSGIWSICQNLIEHRPVFGNGPRTIELLFGLDQINWFRPFHCHNQFIDDLTNFGLFGGIWVSLSVILVALGYQKIQPTVIPVLSLTFLVCGLFESPLRFWSPLGYIWTVVVFASLIFAKPWRGVPNP